MRFSDKPRLLQKEDEDDTHPVRPGMAINGIKSDFPLSQNVMVGEDVAI